MDYDLEKKVLFMNFIFSEGNHVCMFPPGTKIETIHDPPKWQTTQRFTQN